MTAIVAQFVKDRITPPRAYTPTLRALHWLTAALILIAIGLALLVLQLPRGPLRSDLLLAHKSIGLTVFALVAVRIVVRLATAAPKYVPALGRLNHLAAGLGHFALYALMIALPVTGYVKAAAARNGFAWFGLFPVPMWLSPDKELARSAGAAHLVFAYAIGAVLVLHLGAVVWHAAVKKDHVLERMWPRKPGA
jgi:cytochrome b561